MRMCPIVMALMKNKKEAELLFRLFYINIFASADASTVTKSVEISPAGMA